MIGYIIGIISGINYLNNCSGPDEHANEKKDDPENILIMELKENRIVEIELLPDIAPNHVKRI